MLSDKQVTKTIRKNIISKACQIRKRYVSVPGRYRDGDDAEEARFVFVVVSFSASRMHCALNTAAELTNHLLSNHPTEIFIPIICFTLPYFALITDCN